MSDSGQQRVVSAALAILDRARRGDPVVIMVEGEPGVGKSHVLDEIVARADGFRVLTTEAVEGDLIPMGSLAGWGIGPERSAGWSPVAGAEQIRQILEADGSGRPMVLALEDLQWADAESVEAIVAFMQRAVGERLALVVTTRPFGIEHPTWRRWAGRAAAVHRLVLSGLSLDEAIGLVRRRKPELPEATARTLWEYTSGSPLFLAALLAEHDEATLRRSRVLPAPAQFAELTGQRMSRLGEGGLTLLRSLAILGTGWTPVSVVTSVADPAGAEDSVDALDDLVASGLVKVREMDGVLELRTDHALVTSAVYHSIPLLERRRLHLRAAAVVAAVDAAIGHRVAAAVGHDDPLADEIVRYAEQCYARRAFRFCAQLLRWAAGLAADPDVRETCALDALFVGLLAGDVDAVRSARARLDTAGDRARAGLVLGAAEAFQGNFGLAREHLRAADAAAPPDARRLHYRIESLLGWAALASGAGNGEVIAVLDRAEASGVTDAATTAHASYARAMAEARSVGVHGSLAALAGLPEDPLAVPDELRYALGWRGSMRLLAGRYDQAVVDLGSTLGGIMAGREWELLPGTIRTFLGSAYWLRGDWEMEALHVRLVTSATDTYRSSLVLSTLSHGSSGRGDFDQADALLAECESALAVAPWQEPAQYLYFAKVIRLHADSTAGQRARLLPDLRSRLPVAVQPTGLVAASWLLHAAQGAIWAGELDLAAELIALLETDGGPAWGLFAVDWLRGLAAERAGDRPEALRLLRRSTRQPASLPFYRAHLLADLARLERGWGDDAAGRRAAQDALDIYRRLGARPYLDRTAALAADSPEATSPPYHSDSGLVAGDFASRYGLSEREVDVCTLLVNGMSYVQIAKELFITRSTVAYHLGNVYAKTGVSSRHDLVDLIRRPVSAGRG